MSKQPRILIVDDDATVREVLKIQLQAKGWEIAIAADGQQALDTLKTNAFDLVILDLVMPGLDGIQVLEKTVGRYPHTPIIILIGQGSEETVVEVMKKGAKNYLTKPIQHDKLIAAVQEQLDARPQDIHHVLALRLDQFVKNNLGNAQFNRRQMLKHFEISSTYAWELFRENLGMGFQKLLAKYRIDAAMHYLDTTDKSIGEIGSLCGFGSPQAFRNGFHRLKGMSPSKYRTIGGTRM